MNISARITEEMAAMPNLDGSKVRLGQVEAAIRLIDEGNTIPFIARYRKAAPVPRRAADRSSESGG